MNMLSAARATAEHLGCLYAECWESVLCSEVCKRRQDAILKKIERDLLNQEATDAVADKR